MTIKGRPLYIVVEAPPEQRAKNASLAKARASLEAYVPKSAAGEVVPDYRAGILYWKPSAEASVDQYLNLGSINRRTQEWAWTEATVKSVLPDVDFQELSLRTSELMQS